MFSFFIFSSEEIQGPSRASDSANTESHQKQRQQRQQQRLAPALSSLLLFPPPTSFPSPPIHLSHGCLPLRLPPVAATWSSERLWPWPRQQVLLRLFVSPPASPTNLLRTTFLTLKPHTPPHRCCSCCYCCCCFFLSERARALSLFDSTNQRVTGFLVIRGCFSIKELEKGEREREKPNRKKVPSAHLPSDSIASISVCCCSLVRFL